MNPNTSQLNTGQGPLPGGSLDQPPWFGGWDFKHMDKAAPSQLFLGLEKRPWCLLGYWRYVATTSVCWLQGKYHRVTWSLCKDQPFNAFKCILGDAWVLDALTIPVKCKCRIQSKGKTLTNQHKDSLISEAACAAKQNKEPHSLIPVGRKVFNHFRKAGLHYV